MAGVEGSEGQEEGQKASVTRKWNVRLGPERNLGRKVKGQRSGGLEGSTRRVAWGPGRRRGGSGRGALTGPMTHTMRSRSSLE